MTGKALLDLAAASPSSPGSCLYSVWATAFPALWLRNRTGRNGPKRQASSLDSFIFSLWNHFPSVSTRQTPQLCPLLSPLPVATMVVQYTTIKS